MVSLPFTLAASWLDRALGLDDSMSLSAENTALGWDHPLPGWAWVLIVLAALALAGWSYHRLLGARPLRIGLALLRAVLLVLIAVLLAGPTLVRTDTTPDPDWLLVMVDRSASLGFEDIALGAGEGAGVVSRDAALREALANQAGVFGDDRLGANRHIVWLGFDRDAYPIDPPTAVDPADAEALAALLPPAQQQATNLRTAVDQALQLAAGRAISGIVLITDAQSPQPTGQPFIDKLAALQAPVYAVPLGSDEQRLDLAIDRIDLPATAFVGDLLPVSVTVRRLDLGPGVVDGGNLDPADVVVKLINADTGEVLDTQTLEDVGLGSPVRLQTQNDTQGDLNLRVEAAYTPGDDAGGDTLETGGEISLSNNTRLASVELIDRPIKVLYVEGTARWEYQFLVSMLTREDSIDSSMLLIDSDRSFVQDGDSPITHFPQTAEELRPYDVIMIGDVRPRYFSDDQLALIRDHVAQRGAGLLWIGGERYTPNFYAGTDLELLLPMTRPGSVGRLVPATGRDVPMEPTPAARLLNLLQLSLGRDTGDGQAQPEWPDNLPAFRWAQDLGPLRPGAKPLANAIGMVDAESGQPQPLVVLYRYGAGETLYVGTDETWRWRRVGGEVFFEQFWIQLIRKLGTARVQQQDDRANFTVGPPVVDLGAAQLVELVIDDPALMRIAPPTIAVTVYQDTSAERSNEEEGGTEPVGEQVGELDLRPVSTPTGTGTPTQSTYRAVWRSDRSGQFVLRVTEPLLEPIGLEASAEVRDPAEEMAHAETDHDRLVRLANGTGGAVIALNDLGRLETLVADLSREITHETRKPLTNTMLALGLILVLLTLEWVLRRVVKLV
ncbi:hypothetical protein OT109_08945 [Phycisphaeraceae bacterium D3-23]